MDTLTNKLNRQGYSARVYSTHGRQSVAQRIADKYSRGHKDIVVIIGHSLGANATFDIANELDRRNIPIELIVTFDATRPQPAPKNVLHLINFYQENGFGKKVSPGSEFKGELTNIDLTADTGLSHTTDQAENQKGEIKPVAYGISLGSAAPFDRLQTRIDRK
jgi:hypothetical protein